MNRGENFENCATALERDKKELPVTWQPVNAGSGWFYKVFDSPFI